MKKDFLDLEVEKSRTENDISKNLKTITCNNDTLKRGLQECMKNKPSLIRILEVIGTHTFFLALDSFSSSMLGYIANLCTLHSHISSTWMPKSYSKDKGLKQV